MHDAIVHAPPPPHHFNGVPVASFPSLAVRPHRNTILTTLATVRKMIVRGMGEPNRHWRFTSDEDEQLRAAVRELGMGNWRIIADRLPGRTARQVRDRWTSYLSEDVRWGAWSVEEDELLLRLYGEYGAKWMQISRRLRGRTDGMVKNRHNHLERQRRRCMMWSESCRPSIRVFFNGWPRRCRSS